MIILPKAIKRLYVIPSKILGFPGGSVVKNPPPKGGDVGTIPRLGRSLGEVHNNPLQYSSLGNPMEKGA